MGRDILGWVEVRGSALAGWSGVIRLDPVVNGRNQKLCDYLFGLPSVHGLDVPAVAAYRGYPKDMSREAIKEILGNLIEDDYFDTTEALSLLREDSIFGAPTYIGYEEIIALNPTDYIGPKEHRLRLMDGQWQLMFRFMALLAEVYTPKDVRLVVWFNS
jgi:hypothetical protein